MNARSKPSNPRRPGKAGRARRARQLELTLPTWGGARAGAGRPPSGPRPGAPHSARPGLSRHHPVHVTLRVRPHVYNLRAKRCLRPILAAFHAANGRHGLRLVHFSVQGNHLHLLVEAESRPALSRGIGALAIRIARALNRVMERTGRVFDGRFHARVLRTPREVRNALAYVLMNAHHHAARLGRRTTRAWLDPCASGAAFDGWRRAPVRPRRSSRAPPAAGSPAERVPVVEPRTWLLSVGWRRHGLLDPGAPPR